MPVLQSTVENILGECEVTPEDATFTQAITVATSVVEAYLGFTLEGDAADVFNLDSEGFESLRLPRTFTGIAVVEDNISATVIVATDLASYGSKRLVRRKSTVFAEGYQRWKVTADTTVTIHPIADNIVATLAARSIRQTLALSATSGMAGFTQVALDGRSATISDPGSQELVSPIMLNNVDKYALDMAFKLTRARSVRL